MNMAIRPSAGRSENGPCRGWSELVPKPEFEADPWVVVKAGARAQFDRRALSDLEHDRRVQAKADIGPGPLLGDHLHHQRQPLGRAQPKRGLDFPALFIAGQIIDRPSSEIASVP